MMRRVLVWTAMLALALSQALSAQEHGAKSGHGRGGQGRDRDGRGPRMMRMDADGDGKISRDEFRGPAEVFDRMDRNGDGVLEHDELAKGREERMAQMKAVWDQIGKDEMFDAIDANGDGVVTKDEFKSADLGQIVGQAMMKARAALGMGGRGGNGKEGGKGGLIQRFDKDGDGLLSADEFPRGREVFERLDENGDGLLDSKEVEAGRRKMRERSKKGRAE